MYTIEELGLKKRHFDPELDKEDWFYKDKNGNIVPYWKEDIKAVVNPLKPATFLPLLELFDVPYFEEEWIRMICSISEDPFRWNNKTVFGSYLSKMKLCAYKPFGFKDSMVLYGEVKDLLDIEYVIQSSVFHKLLKKDN
jgi:hypothetical protein